MTEVHVAGRGEGKTTALVRWLIGGRPLPRYPMWSRVLLVSDHARREYVGKAIVGELGGLWTPELEAEISHQLEDEHGYAAPSPHTLTPYQTAELVLCRAVWVASGGQRLHGLDHDIEVAVDDAQTVLGALLGLYRDPARLAINGEVWTP